MVLILIGLFWPYLAMGTLDRIALGRATPTAGLRLQQGYAHAYAYAYALPTATPCLRLPLAYPLPAPCLGLARV